ncbi:MAG: type IX secretion system outer membrane channel protein PorV [Saprospiraceae bacterium]|nr:type IX secretion system outer membrane channel protein PorV [Saprospiraceae bacterium]
MRFFAIFLYLIGSLSFLNAQYWDATRGCIVNQSGDCVSNTLLTALPFLRITPDARSGALGDAGVALSPDPNAMHHNAARLAFAEQDMSFSATMSPWLRNLGIDDIYLFYLSGYKKLDNLQTVGGSLRFFSLGSIDFKDENGNDLGTGNPFEFEISAAYSRKLSSKLSASLTAKYAQSSLASNRTIGGTQIIPARTFAADLGFFYKSKMGASGRSNYLSIGGAITNLGSKVAYTKTATRDFIPTNLALGGNYEMNFDDYNSLNVILEISKLMVPSTIPFGHPEFDADTNKIADYREKPLFEGIFGSFGDAVGGFKEETQELMYSVGMEYWYDKQFAVRMGYFHEHAFKGNRKFFTLGCGVKYNIFGINLSYLVPTNITRSPLANTLRFSFVFDLGAFEAENE